MRYFICSILFDTRLSGRGEVVKKPSPLIQPAVNVKSNTAIPRLKEDERAYIKARLEKDQGRSARERRITFRDVVNCFKDFKFILGGFMYFGLIVPGKWPFPLTCIPPDLEP